MQVSKLEAFSRLPLLSCTFQSTVLCPVAALAILLPKELDEKVAKLHIPQPVQSSPSVLGNTEFPEAPRFKAHVRCLVQHIALSRCRDRCW